MTDSSAQTAPGPNNAVHQRIASRAAHFTGNVTLPLINAIAQPPDNPGSLAVDINTDQLLYGDSSGVWRPSGAAGDLSVLTVTDESASVPSSRQFASSSSVAFVDNGPGSTVYFDANVTLASAGGSQSLVADGTGPTLSILGLSAGTGISLGASGGALTITNASPASAVMLSSPSTTPSNQTLVNDGVGPAIATKALLPGTGISLGSNSTDITITNADPASAVTFANAGVALGNEGVVASSSAAPTFKTKGLVAGAGIGITSDGTDITITNLGGGGGGGVTLDSVGTGGSQSLVFHGTGPDLTILGLRAGTGLTITTPGTDSLTITNSSPATGVVLANGGSGETLVALGGGTGPSLSTKGVLAGVGIGLSSTSTDLTITNSDPGSAVTLASAGGSQSLVVNGGAPFPLTTRGLTAGTGVTLTTPTTSAVLVTNSSPASAINFTTAVGSTGSSLVNTNATPTLRTMGLLAGGGISLGSNATDVTITNTDGASTVNLSSAGGSQTLVSNGTGPNLSVLGLTAGTGITFTTSASAITVTNSSPYTSVSLQNMTGMAGASVLASSPQTPNPNLYTKGILAGTNIAVTTSASDITISTASTVSFTGNSNTIEASALSTTNSTAPVVISSSAPPIAGQALVATSATAASWQTVNTPVVSRIAANEFIHGSTFANTSTLSVSLLANKTYSLDCRLLWNTSHLITGIRFGLSFTDTTASATTTLAGDTQYFIDSTSLNVSRFTGQRAGSACTSNDLSPDNGAAFTTSPVTSSNFATMRAAVTVGTAAQTCYTVFGAETAGDDAAMMAGSIMMATQLN
jgi:hypothetical protein